MKIGLLYSSSKQHPNLVADFLNGIKSAIKHFHRENEIELISESVGFGGVEKEVYEKAEKLMLIENVDMIIAYIDLRVLTLIEPLIYSNGKLFVIVNAGANYPEDKVPQKNIIYLSLRHSFLSWLTGVKAGKSGSAQAMVATSFYDAGYLQISGMTRGFAKNGGAVRFNYVNKSKYDESFEIGPLVEYLSSEKKIDTVFAIFDSRPASLFFDRINEVEGSGELSLYVSPMMLEPSVLRDKDFNFSIEGYMPYDATGENTANLLFRDQFKKDNKKDASMFALQGWEAGLVIEKVLASAREDYADGSAIQEYLLNQEIDSPRGKLTLDDSSNYYIAPVNHARMNPHEKNLLIKQEEKDAEWADFLLNPITGVVSGWTNTYLCY